MPLPERLDGIPADFFDEAHHLQQQINNKYGLIPGVSDKVELLYRPRNTQDGPLEFPLDPRILNSDLMRISEVIDEPLLPPTLDIQNLPEDFTRQYALRTAIYVRLIESIRSGEDLTAEEIEDIRLTLQTLNNIDRYDHNPNRSLYDDQMDMFHAIRETLEQGEREMYVKIPTGVGKTAIFAEFVEAFTHDNERKVLIIVPWQDLVTQTANEVVRFANQQAGQVYQHSRDYSQQVTVITRDSLHAALANGDLLPEDYDLVIGDEAHRLVGEEYSQDIRQFTHAVKIGFTATPAYDEKRHVRNVFSKEAYSMTVDEAVARDLITPYENWIALTRGSGNARAQREDVTQIILDNFINQIGMVNCESIEDAEEQAQVIRELLDKYGLHHINVAAYHSNLSNNTREQLLQQWMQGTTQILCQIRTLGEGINNPRATFCINSYPRYSAVDEEQTGGRVLRKDPNNPNKVGIIVDCVDENADPRKLPYTFTEVAGGGRKLTSRNRRELNEARQQRLYTREEETDNREYSAIVAIIKNPNRVAEAAEEIQDTREEALHPGRDFFEPITVGHLSKEFDLYDNAVTNVLREIMVERPDLVIQTKGKGGWMIEPQEGMRLLTTRLEERNYQVPEGMLSFALNEWEERYGIYYAAIREILIKHKARNPEGVHIGGKGKRYGISPDILEEVEADINNKVQQLQYESQGYTRLTRQMAKDMNVTILTLYKWLREMEEQGTPGIYRTNRKEFYLEPHVIEMLRQKSPEPLQGESFTVDSRGLAEEYELTQGQITDIVRQLRNRPDLGGHITGIPGKPLSATSEGLHAIREELERRRIPRGYKRVPMGDLTSNSGLPVNRIRRIIDQLKNSGFAAEFTVGGLQNNNCATQTGLRLIIDQVYRETGTDLSYLLGE